MMSTSFVIALAGLKIKIHALYEDVQSYCRDYLTDATDIDFEIEISPADLLAEEAYSRKQFALEGLTYPDFTPGELEKTAVYRKIAAILPHYDGVVFHGAAVCVDNAAYLFTARSGVGKTTHLNLWLKNIPGAFVINGDKPILRFEKDHIEVYGTPWAGKEGMQRNVSVPLKGLAILKRSRENVISKINFSTALPVLLTQVHRPENETADTKTISFLEKLGRCVELYTLSCNMDDAAARVAYQGMCHAF